jgi:hypothetical protein
MAALNAIFYSYWTMHAKGGHQKLRLAWEMLGKLPSMSLAGMRTLLTSDGRSAVVQPGSLSDRRVGFSPQTCEAYRESCWFEAYPPNSRMCSISRRTGINSSGKQAVGCSALSRCTALMKGRRWRNAKKRCMRHVHTFGLQHVSVALISRLWSRRHPAQPLPRDGRTL